MQEQDRRDFLSQFGQILIKEGAPFRNYITNPKNLARLLQEMGDRYPTRSTIKPDSRGNIAKIGAELVRLAKDAPSWSGNPDGEFEREGLRLGKQLMEIGREHFLGYVVSIGDCVIQLAIQPLGFLEQNRLGLDGQLKKP